MSHVPEPACSGMPSRYDAGELEGAVAPLMLTRRVGTASPGGRLQREIRACENRACENRAVPQKRYRVTTAATSCLELPVAPSPHQAQLRPASRLGRLGSSQMSQVWWNGKYYPQTPNGRHRTRLPSAAALVCAVVGGSQNGDLRPRSRDHSRFMAAASSRLARSRKPTAAEACHSHPTRRGTRLDGLGRAPLAVGG
jgi:hypothetical protein